MSQSGQQRHGDRIISGTGSEQHDVTQLLQQWRAGDAGAMDKLSPLVYNSLKGIARHQMRRERSDNTLQATVLVNEAYMQLIGGEISWSDSAHFRAIAANIMRRTLVDHARERNAQKRGGDVDKLTLMESRVIDNANSLDVLELDEVLKRFAEFDERKARVIELTFFGGMSYQEVGEVLGISKATVERELRLGKAWLYRELNPEGS